MTQEKSSTKKIEIEKGIPLPATRRGPEPKYPLHEMVVGDSILIPNVKINTLSTMLSAHKRKYGRKFVCRATEGGIRVWYIGEVDRDSAEDAI